MGCFFRNIFFKLNRILDDNYEYYLSFYLIFNVIWIFFGMFLCNYTRFSYHSFSTSYVLLFVFNFFVILFLNIFKKVNFDLIDIFLILLVFFGIISTIFSKNISISLYGYWRRYEGLFQLLYYYSLMYLSVKILNDVCKKWIIRFILFFGLVNVFFCFIQVFDILKFIPVALRGTVLGQGLIGNSNFFGSYMVLCLGISIGFYLYSYDISFLNRLFYLFICLLFFSGLFMSNCLSGVVGLFVVCVFIILYYIYMYIKKLFFLKNFVRHVILFVSFFIVFVLLSCCNRTIIKNDIFNYSKETSEIMKGNINDSYGSCRIFIWKESLRVVPKYLIHGVGIDNFSNAFGDYLLYGRSSETFIVYYDKAHNEYLQKLICEGIFSCITYIIMLFLIFIKSIKENIKYPNYISISLFFGFVGYLTQAFFNISVIEVAPLFWIVSGLLYDEKCKKIYN